MTRPPSPPPPDVAIAGTRTADYDFTLPADRIAQVPAERRDQSRLMVVRRATGTIEHRHFADIVELIAPGDAMAVNTTRVLRARLLGTRDSGGKAEVFLLKSLGDDRFEALVHPGGKLKPGRVVHVAPELDVEILEVTQRRSRVVRLRSPLALYDAIERFGHVPLPPYTFRAVDKIITNFHLPRSTLIMLVAAFAGYDLTMRAYRTALEEGYRFYSYGDAMAIL